MSMSRQRGLTFYQSLIALLLVVFFALVAIKLVPVYVDNYTIRTAMANVASEIEMDGLTPGKVRAALNKHLNVNMIDVNAEDIEISEVEGGLAIDINYEVRVPLFYNLDVVASFENHEEIQR